MAFLKVHALLKPNYRNFWCYISLLLYRDSVNVFYSHSQLGNSLNVKTVLFQSNQFSIRAQFSSIWPIDRKLPGATGLGQSGLESDGNVGFPHSAKLNHYWRLTIRLFRVIIRTLFGRILISCRHAVDVFKNHSRLDQEMSWYTVLSV